MRLLWLLQLPWTHTAEDSVRVVVSAQGWLAHLLPSIPLPVIIAAVAIVTSFAFHYLELLVQRIPQLAPIAQAWSDRKAMLNPALVTLSGWLLSLILGLHLPGIWGVLIGVIAAGLRSMVKQPTSPEAFARVVDKAKVAVVIGLLVPWILMAFCTDSMAEQPTGNPLIDAAAAQSKPSKPGGVWSFSPGVGYRWAGGVGDAQAHAFGDGQLAYARTRLRFKATLQVGKEMGYGQRGEVFGYVRIGPYF